MVTKLTQTFWDNFDKYKEVRDMTYKEISEGTTYSVSNLTTSASNRSSLLLDKGFAFSGAVGENLVILLGADEAKDKGKLIYPKNEVEAEANFWKNVDNLEDGQDITEKRKKVLKTLKLGWRKDFITGSIKVTWLWLERLAEAYSWEAYELLCKKAN